MMVEDQNVTILRTERLVLRAPNKGDIPNWFLRATDQESARLAGDRIPDDIAEGAEWLARSQARAMAGERLQWCIDFPDVALSIGTVSLSLRKPELSFVLGRPFWGKGLATEAARASLNQAFGSLALEDVRADVVSCNGPSLRVLAKLGFRKKGTFVDETDGELCETHVVTKNQFPDRVESAVAHDQKRPTESE